MGKAFRVSSIVLLVAFLAGCTESASGAPVMPPNRAGVDTATCQQVLDMVRDDLETVFPMVAQSTPGNRPELVRQRLVGAGENDVTAVMTDYLNHTKVDEVADVDAAVVRLTGDHASVLVFGWLVEDPTGANFRQEVTMLIGLDRLAGTWRISRVSLDPTEAPLAGGPGPAPDAQIAERDAAVSAAVTLATRLTEFDASDPEASYDKWFKASVEPLTTKLRTAREEFPPGDAVTVTVSPRPIVAPVYVRPGDASLLVSLYTHNSQGSALQALRIQVVRVEDGSWRAADLTQLHAVGGGS
ncbi:hypothetical protein [Labedaea rhizosphaerae]|uniref:Mce-associated membrane protein n=1 Tax=Labedaea rhizosphaerae TaxID=598644 RepID=A0A4R6RT15_LABRH|nr:hypothetical protein [Labedaea rhizosphaerae]TDP89970.1 hypothetical protein EV186_11196 [Labedaea rhizosphaerae]